MTAHRSKVRWRTDAFTPGVYREDVHSGNCKEHVVFKTILSATTLAAAILLAGPAHAQQHPSASTAYAMIDDGYRAENREERREERADDRDRRDREDNGATVTCESVDNRRAFCATGGARHVRLVAQISDSACIKGRSWDYNSRGIWVANGCRAEFKVR